MKSSIRFEGVSKSYDGDVILSNINLTIPSGSFFVLLGPSGSGKTTLLRLIGGFETVDRGQIFIGDQEITHLPINERRVNTVFQQYALFPHMNVYENVAYGLRIRKMPISVIEERVHSVLARVHLEKHIRKDVSQLSGGQQQRVALARAIINEPDVLLLDEPLAALDLKLREQMLVELMDLQYELKTTFVYVTHDQFEALTVATQMAIMSTNGAIEQIGTPKEIYEFPNNTFVAQFVGTTNIFWGNLQLLDSRNPELIVDGVGALPITIPSKIGLTHGSSAYMSIRPEKIKISKLDLDDFSNKLPGVVETIVYYGRSTQYRIKLANGMRLQVFQQNEEHFPQEIIDYDDRVYVYWQKNNVVILER